MADHVDMRVHKSMLTNKIGPLPTWAWMLIGLGLAIAISVVRSNKKNSDAKAAEQSTGTDANGVQLVGGNQRPPIVFQDYVTSIFQPPAGGRTCPPACPPPPAPACSGPACPPPCPPDSGPPCGQWVTLSKCGRGGRRQWDSDIYGCAQQLCGSRDKWKDIWDCPENAPLRTRRKSPDACQPGDRVWCPGGNGAQQPSSNDPRRDNNRGDQDRRGGQGSRGDNDPRGNDRGNSHRH